MSLASPLLWHSAAVVQVLLLLTSHLLPVFPLMLVSFLMLASLRDWCSFFFSMHAVVLHSAVDTGGKFLPLPFLIPVLNGKTLNEKILVHCPFKLNTRLSKYYCIFILPVSLKKEEFEDITECMKSFIQTVFTITYVGQKSLVILTQTPLLYTIIPGGDLREQKHPQHGSLESRCLSVAFSCIHTIKRCSCNKYIITYLKVHKHGIILKFFLT